VTLDRMVQILSRMSAKHGRRRTAKSRFPKRVLAVGRFDVFHTAEPPSGHGDH